jgi:hypothetical protein
MRRKSKIRNLATEADQKIGSRTPVRITRIGEFSIDGARSQEVDQTDV